MNWSNYQKDIFEEVVNGVHNIVVEAVPGSGKTTTMTEAIKMYLSKYPYNSITALSFTKHIATVLTEKIDHAMQDVGVKNTVNSRTVNSLGHSILYKNKPENAKRIKLETRKYSTIIKQTLGKMQRKSLSKDDAEQQWDTVKNLVNFARLHIVDCADLFQLNELAGKIGKPIVDNDLHIVSAVLREGIKRWENYGECDFTDQLWLPHVLDMTSFRADIIFVDEAQDLSPAALSLIIKSGKRFIFVGDKSQSIFGFAGADTSSMDNIVKTVDAKTMPLSVTYRCPESHVELLKNLNPSIEAAQGASYGEVVFDDASEISPKAGDLVMCRINKPLIKMFFDLLKDGQAAVMKGRDTAKQLVSHIKKVREIYGDTYEDLVGNMNLYLIDETKRTDNWKDNKYHLARIKDLNDSVQAVYEGKKRSGFDQMIDDIYFMFENKGNCVTLSSVHRAKGDEANRTFLIDYYLYSYFQGRAPSVEAANQEFNVEYVALSRSKDVMVIQNRFGDV